MADEAGYSSPWIAAPAYQIVVASSGLPGDTLKKLESYKLKPMAHISGLHHTKTGSDWVSSWQVISALLSQHDPHGKMLVAVIGGDQAATERELGFHLKPRSEIDAVAKHLWLASALAEERLLCFMQRVVDRRGKQIGYEAFARIEQEDGTIVDGGAIMEASRALRIEYQLDRMMHKQAIRNYIEGDLEGYLFINFLTGFIHRPEVYLDGLSQAVDKHHLLPRFVVLDVPLPDYKDDYGKLSTIAHYCRVRGFAMAFDDVASATGLEALLAEIRPAFVKLDGKIAQKNSNQLPQIVQMTHETGAMVLAEGVETEELHNTYLATGVDLFQGYLFGKPERRHAKIRSAKTGS